MKKFAFSIIVLTMFFNFSKSQTVEYIKELKISEKSSFSKKISSFLFGKPKLDIFPFGICVLNKDQIVITDTKSGSIILLNNEGKILKRINSIKSLPLGQPVSVCNDKNGNIYVSDSQREGIVKISNNFKKVSLFASIKGARTTGITVGENKLYCIDTKNHKIFCFDLEGNLLFNFGKRGLGDGEFNYPTHIIIHNKKLFVVDAMNFRVQIFTENGIFLNKFGKHGDGGGSFSKPKGISIDNKGRVFIADVMFDNIQIFNKSGVFLYVFGVPGKEKKQFWMPSDIDIFDDYIYVTDTFNKRIQIFKIKEGNK